MTRSVPGGKSMIAGELLVPAAVAWAHEQLEGFTWRDEVTFQGLMLIADLVHHEEDRIG